MPASNGLFLLLLLGIFSGFQPMVSAMSLPWFNQNIPRMSFIMWMAIKGKLPTLERIAAYRPLVVTSCPLCHGPPESIDHLFFKCSYSEAIWRQIIRKCRVVGIPHSWHLLIPWASSSWNGKSARSVVKRLCLAASVYFIWKERNCRISETLFAPYCNNQVSFSVMRRLCSIGFRTSLANAFLMEDWNVFIN